MDEQDTTQGPSQPPAPIANGTATPTKDEMNMAMLCHLLGIFTGFIGPLVIWLMKKDESEFIDEAGKESVNFQIFVTIVMFVGAIVSVVLGFITFGLGMCLTIPLMAGMGITFLVFEIIATVETNKGEVYRYPITFRFIS